MNELLTPQQLTIEAFSAYQAGDYNDAAIFEATRRGYFSASNPYMGAEMANNCNVAFIKAGDNEATLTSVEGIDDIFIQIGDLKNQAMTLGNRAVALEALNRFDEAEKTYWMASEIFKELGETELRFPVMQSISALQLRRGQQFQAISSIHAGSENIVN